MRISRTRIPNPGAHLGIELDADPVILQADTSVGGLPGGIVSRQRSPAQANSAGGNPGNGSQLEKSASAGTRLLHATSPLKRQNESSVLSFYFILDDIASQGAIVPYGCAFRDRLTASAPLPLC